MFAAHSDGAFTDGPDRGRILLSGRETGGRFSLMQYVAGPGAARETDGPLAFGAHRHRECEETFLVVAGEIEFLLGGRTMTLFAGDRVTAPAGVRHGFANTSAADAELLVGFIPAGIEELFVKYGDAAGKPADGAGFIAEATQRHASEFGLDGEGR